MFASKLHDLQRQKVATPEFKNLSKDLDKAKASLDRLYDRRDSYTELGKKTPPKLELDISDAERKIRILEADIKELITTDKAYLPVDTSKVEQEITAAEQKQMQMYTALQTSADALTQKVSAQAAEEERIAQIRVNAVASDDQIIAKAERIRQLEQEIADLKASGITEGYADYDGRIQELSTLKQEVKEYKDSLLGVPEEFSRMRASAQKAFSAMVGGFSTVGKAGKKTFSGIISISKKAFSGMASVSKKVFSAILGGSRQSSGFLSNFTSQLKNIVSAAFVFNLIRKGFNSMVSGMKTGFTNLMGYSNSFANSIQSMKNSLSTLGNQIAAAFAPVVQAVIPWLNQLINVLSIAMSYVSQFIAALTGRSTYIRAKKVQDSFNSSLGDTSSKADDAAHSMDDMADSAKKARGALATFDDLDVLEKQDDSAADKIKDLDNAIKDLGSGAGSGMGDLFEEVPIESSILDAVEKLKDILAQLFAPLKEAWEREGQFVMDSWKYALSEIWRLMKDIGHDFLTMWNQDETVRMLANILHIFGDIGLVIGNIAHALDEAWNKNNTGLHILENIRDIFAVIIQNIREAADYTVEWSKMLNFSPLLESIEHLTKAFVPLADFVSGTLADFYTQFILPLASWTISENGLPRLVNILSDFMDAVDWESLRASLKNLYSALEPYAEAIGEGLIDFIEKLKDIGVTILNAFPEPIQKLANALASGDPQKVREWTTTILEFVVAIEGIKLAFKGFEIVRSGLALFGIGGAASTVATTASEAAGGITLLSSAISGLAAVAAGLGIVEALKDPIFDLAEAAGVSSDKADYMGERYRGLGGDLNLIKDPVSILTNGFQGLGWEMSNAMGASGALETAMNNIAEGMVYTDDKLSKMQKNFGLTNEDMEMLRQAMLDMHPELLELANGFEGLNDASIESLQQIYTGLQDVSNGVTTANSVTADMADKFGGLTDTASTFFDNMKNGADYVSYYENSVKSASDATQQFSDDINEAGKNIGDGITKGFENADVETPVRGFFASIVDSLRSVFNMHSPAKNMEPLGENILLGVLEGFKNTFGKVGDTIAKLLQNIQKSFSESWTNIQKNTSEVWTKIQEWLTRTMQDIQKFFTDIWNDIQNWFTGFWNRFTKALQEVWNNIVMFFGRKFDEIKQLFNAFISFVNNTFISGWTNAWNKASDAFNSFKSKIEGIVNGIKDILGSFVSWVSDIVSKITSFIGKIGESVTSANSSVGQLAETNVSGRSVYSVEMVSALNDIPQLASGAVLRGGNPFMAILNEQPRGQTNIEAPLKTIEQAVENVISRKGYNNMPSGGLNPTISLNVNGQEFARLTLGDILNEMGRQGYDVDLLGYT